MQTVNSIKHQMSTLQAEIEKLQTQLDAAIEGNKQVINPYLQAVSADDAVCYFLGDNGINEVISDKLYVEHSEPCALYPTRKIAEQAMAIKRFNDKLLAFKYVYEPDYVPTYGEEEVNYFIWYSPVDQEYIVTDYKGCKMPMVCFSSEQIALKCADWLNSGAADIDIKTMLPADMKIDAEVPQPAPPMCNTGNTALPYEPYGNPKNESVHIKNLYNKDSRPVKNTDINTWPTTKPKFACSSGLIKGNKFQICDNYVKFVTKQGNIAYVDREDWDKVKSFYWKYHKDNGVMATYHDENGKYRRISLARYILGLDYSEQVKYVSGNKLDCRKDNLRAKSYMNVRNDDSYFRGVFKSRHLWGAGITINGVYKDLGLFASQEEAIEARKQAELDIKKKK